MDAGSTPKGMLIYSGRTVLRWGNFRNSFGYFFASPYLALSMTVLPFFFHGHDFSYIVSHLLRVTIRSFLFRFSLRSLGLLLREPGDSRGFFFFFLRENSSRKLCRSKNNYKARKILEIARSFVISDKSPRFEASD